MILRSFLPEGIEILINLHRSLISALPELGESDPACRVV